jgi:molybdopterin converting factor small subunit
VEARTVGEVLAELKDRFPALAAQLFGTGGDVAPSMNLFLGEDDVRSLGGLEAPVAPGQELSVVPALSGGCS